MTDNPRSFSLQWNSRFLDMHLDIDLDKGQLDKKCLCLMDNDILEVDKEFLPEDKVDLGKVIVDMVVVDMDIEVGDMVTQIDRVYCMKDSMV